MSLGPAAIGTHVRRIDDRTHRYTPWAQIVMNVPSRLGDCWMVSFIDGDVDVWRCDDTEAQYQFRFHADQIHADQMHADQIPPKGVRP
jgi:hypothetical protein